MTWTDKSEYDGEWVRGIQHGQGIMKMASGEIVEGHFENNGEGQSQIKRNKKKPANKS